MLTPQRTTETSASERPRNGGLARDEEARRARALCTPHTMLDELDEEYLHELWMVLGLDD